VNDFQHAPLDVHRPALERHALADTIAATRLRGRAYLELGESGSGSGST